MSDRVRRTISVEDRGVLPGQRSSSNVPGPPDAVSLVSGLSRTLSTAPHTGSSRGHPAEHRSSRGHPAPLRSQSGLGEPVSHGSNPCGAGPIVGSAAPRVGRAAPALRHGRTTDSPLDLGSVQAGELSKVHAVPFQDMAVVPPPVVVVNSPTAWQSVVDTQDTSCR